jgi:hypothetical protein
VNVRARRGTKKELALALPETDLTKILLTFHFFFHQSTGTVDSCGMLDDKGRMRRMRQHRLALGSVISVAAGVTVIYTMSILFALPVACILGLCFSSMVALVWMAIRILKDPYSTDKTFDAYFYRDRDDIRRSGKE